MTLVSVIMPNYNHGRFIERAVKSVTSQTHSELELIVIDDGSTDDSMTRVERLARDDSRIKVQSNGGNHGLPYSRNRGLEAASGQYLCFIDSDDIFRPERVEKMLGIIENRQGTFSFGDVFKIDDQDQVTQASCFTFNHVPPDGRAYTWLLCHAITGVAAIMVPRSIVQEIGFYDETLSWAEDWDYLLRLAERFEMAIVHEPLYGYRIHKARMTARMVKIARERIEVQILESNLARNWQMFDDNAKYRMIRRIQQSAIATNDVLKLVKWSTKPPFIRVGSKKLLNRLP